jgi:hypothetical protein
MPITPEVTLVTVRVVPLILPSKTALIPTTGSSTTLSRIIQHLASPEDPPKTSPSDACP